MIQITAYFELNQAGYLQVSGEDRLAFLQRQTTNDIRLLSARQVTYDKITQRLSGVRLDSHMSPGVRLWAGEKLAGVVTSSAQSPRYGMIALAMLKRLHDLTGTRLEAEDEGRNRSPARVVDLPFIVDQQELTK